MATQLTLSLDGNTGSILANNIAINPGSNGVVDTTNAASVLVPTVIAGDSSTKAANTSFVTNAVSGLNTNLLAANNVWTGTDTFNNNVTLNSYSTYLGKEIATIQSRAGEIWSISNLTQMCFALYYGNGVWVTSGNGIGLYYSLDGITWVQSNIKSGVFSVVYYANGMWSAGGNGVQGLYYSLDGITWTVSNISSGGFQSFYYSNGIWVAGGGSNRPGLWYSLDGITWVLSNITTVGGPSVYYSNGIWVAATGGGLYYSPDGITWTISNITTGYYSCVYYSNGIWVAAATNGGGLYYSLNGITWTISNISTINVFVVYYGNGIWVAGMGSGVGLYYSLDGITWIQSNITTGYYSCVYYANGIWVAGSNLGGFYYSLDGKIWTISNITESIATINEAYYAGKWVATSNVGSFYSTSIIGQSYYEYISSMLSDNFSLSLNEPQTTDLILFRQECLKVIDNKLSDSDLPPISNDIIDLVESFIVYREAKDKLNDYARLTLPFFYNQLTLEETNNLNNYLQELQLVITEFGANQELPFEPDIPLLDSVI